jgi:hypothetical protein
MLLPAAMLADEARALLTRLARVRPFALVESMVPAAALPPQAQAAIETFLLAGRRDLRRRVGEFLAWLRSPYGAQAGAEGQQRRFSFLRLRFNVVLSQFDIFADVLTQRSEHDTGVWLAGLDVAAADALAIPGHYFEAPPVICYLDRGHGAAIRRARTRLPGGAESPVAVVRVPRERMVGSGIGSSLFHEVGHQGSALLGLIPSLQSVLKGFQTGGAPECAAWRLWERWISEIIADFWAVARLGVSATTGLIGVVSLPRPFVFRIRLDDPHPFPWIRVKLSSAMGDALYPDPQWVGLSTLWERFYPKDGLAMSQLRTIALLESTLPAFVNLLVTHRPRALRGRTLAEAMGTVGRQPVTLRRYYAAWQARPELLRTAPPSLALAGIGQARADSRITPEDESRLLGDLLAFWAVRRTFGALSGSTLGSGARSRRVLVSAVQPAI